MPSITIITICFNNLQDVINTCNSVDMHCSNRFEHLLIDGSTKPDIKNYLETNTQPSYRRWICERDNGISDAFNKGVLNAGGDILVMLNSGDGFYDEQAMTAATTAFNDNPSIQWLHAKYCLIRGNRKVIIGKPFEKGKVIQGHAKRMPSTMFCKEGITH